MRNKGWNCSVGTGGDTMADAAYVRIGVMTRKEFKEYQRTHPNEKFDYYYQYDHRQRRIYSVYQYVTKKES